MWGVGARRGEGRQGEAEDGAWLRERRGPPDQAKDQGGGGGVARQGGCGVQGREEEAGGGGGDGVVRAGGVRRGGTSGWRDASGGTATTEHACQRVRCPRTVDAVLACNRP